MTEEEKYIKIFKIIGIPMYTNHEKQLMAYVCVFSSGMALVDWTPHNVVMNYPLHNHPFSNLFKDLEEMEKFVCMILGDSSIELIMKLKMAKEENLQPAETSNPVEETARENLINGAKELLAAEVNSPQWKLAWDIIIASKTVLEVLKDD